MAPVSRVVTTMRLRVRTGATAISIEVSRVPGECHPARAPRSAVAGRLAPFGIAAAATRLGLGGRGATRDAIPGAGGRRCAGRSTPAGCARVARPPRSSSRAGRRGAARSRRRCGAKRSGARRSGARRGAGTARASRRGRARGPGAALRAAGPSPAVAPGRAPRVPWRRALRVPSRRAAPSAAPAAACSAACLRADPQRAGESSDRGLAVRSSEPEVPRVLSCLR